MKRLLLASVAFCAALFCAGALSHTIIYVGDNPFGASPNTGGSGQIEGCNAGTPPDCTITKNFTSLGVIPIVIDNNGTASTGVDHLIINERVTNNTGVDWTDFHFQLVGIDNNSALTVAFLNVTNPTGQWTSIVPGVDMLDLYGLVANGDTFSLSFDLQITSEAGSFDLFAINEFPTVAVVPIPATLVLFGIAFAGLGFARKRK